MAENNEESKRRARIMSMIKNEAEGVDLEKNDIYDFTIKIPEEELLNELINRKKAWKEYKKEFGISKRYEFTEEFKNIIEKYTSINTHRMAKNENYALMRYITANAEDPDIAKTKLIKWLMNFVDFEEGEEVTQIQMAGKQGAGKTQLAFLLAELWKLMNPDGRILTNVKGVKQTTFVGGIEDLDEWLEENDKPFILVMDELNKHASGSDHEDVLDQMYSLITYLRKKKGNYIIIGHNGKDIHPWIRDLCHFIYKESNKVAKVYESVNESGEGENHIKTLRGIPKSTLEPDTYDESSWEWGEEVMRNCIGTRQDGERCGAVNRADYGDEPDLFCAAHQNQEEPHPDVKEEELVGTEYEDYISTDDDEKGEDTQTEEDEEKNESEETEKDPNLQSQTQGSTQTETDLTDIPDHYFETVKERTGGLYTKNDNIRDLDQLMELLPDSKADELKDYLN